MKAFTLIEVLIVAAIFGLVIGLIFGSHILSQRAYLEGGTLAELTQNGRVILERTTREIRQAKEIVTELSGVESGATSTIIFEDGHIADSYHYISYYQENNEVKREVVGYFFSGDPQQTLIAWDSEPPAGQTLETKILEEPLTIGEYVNNLQFWGSEIINIGLILEQRGKSMNFSTQVFGRNL